MFVKIIENTEELDKAFAIRVKVFVEEQKVSAEVELDEYEPICKHVLVFDEEIAVATGRMRIVGDRAKLERICVLPQYRKCGAGRLIVDKLEELAMTEGYFKLKLHGQIHAQNFYMSLGYEAASEVFMEEGIAHRLFLKQI